MEVKCCELFHRCTAYIRARSLTILNCLERLCYCYRDGYWVSHTCLRPTERFDELYRRFVDGLALDRP